MIISDAAIKKPVITVVVMLGLIVFGIFALTKLDVDEFPDISAPIVFVGIPYPGAAPDQVERDVVDRLEEEFGAISGVDEMSSTSIDGFATVIVLFDFSKDPDRASQEVRDAISAIRDRLPSEMKEPIIRKFDPNDQPIVSLVLASKTKSPADLTLLADPGITRELRGINGVAQVMVVGNVDREISIDARPASLAAAGISVSDIVRAVQTQNISVPVGRITGAFEERSIRLKGRLKTPAEFQQLAVATRGGRVIRLGEVATVTDGTAEQRSGALFNGQPAVGIEITKATGVSTTRVSDAVRAKIVEIQKRLPQGVSLSVVRDSGERVRNSVTNVQHALIEGAALTVLVVFLFLNSWRSTVITGLALPVSVIAAFVAVWAFGFTLNTMSLLGLSLAIGILIDDAIVVRENIVRHVEMGSDHMTAAHEGTNEIGLAVTATTFSIVAVFVPIAFMDGIAGQWFKPFALTIAFSVLVSLFVSFSLDPMLSAYWPDPELEEGQRRNVLSRVLTRFNAWFDRMADRYRGVIAWALDHRWWMITIAVASFAGAILLQATVGGAGFVPESDRSEVNISFETPPGSSLRYSQLKAEEIASMVRKHSEVESTYVSIGSTNGSGGVDSGSVYVRLVPRSQRARSQADMTTRLRDEVRHVGGITTSFSQGGPGGEQKQLAIQVRGEESSALQLAANQILAVVQKVPGAADIGLSTRGQKPELEIELNRGLAGSLDLDTASIAQSLRPSFAGVDAGDWVDPSGKTRDVTVGLSPEARVRESNISQLPLVLKGGGGESTPATLPLGQVAAIRTTVGPAQIDHLNREKVITVGANVQGRSLTEVSNEVNAGIASIQLPAGVAISQGGQVKDQGEVFGNIFAALGLALMLMYFILVVQFGSFLDPLAILLSLPLSLIGVVLALIITGDTLNIMSLIGVMLLMGIVAKNAILLIDFAKTSHERGMPLREALIEAGRVRLRPIMMTTLALIAGMIPVALGVGEGADFRAPLGRAVIGGVITSTLLTLLVIPTVYEILTEWREGLARLFKKGKKGTVVHAPHDQPV